MHESGTSKQSKRNLVWGREATRLDDDLDDRENQRKLRAKKVGDFALRQRYERVYVVQDLKGRREGVRPHPCQMRFPPLITTARKAERNEKLNQWIRGRISKGKPKCVCSISTAKVSARELLFGSDDHTGRGGGPFIK
jgi:hypothetical protein